MSVASSRRSTGDLLYVTSAASAGCCFRRAGERASGLVESPSVQGRGSVPVVFGAGGKGERMSDCQTDRCIAYSTIMSGLDTALQYLAARRTRCLLPSATRRKLPAGKSHFYKTNERYAYRFLGLPATVLVHFFPKGKRNPLSSSTQPLSCDELSGGSEGKLSELLCVVLCNVYRATFVYSHKHVDMNWDLVVYVFLCIGFLNWSHFILGLVFFCYLMYIFSCL